MPYPSKLNYISNNNIFSILLFIALLFTAPCTQAQSITSKNTEVYLGASYSYRTFIDHDLQDIMEPTNYIGIDATAFNKGILGASSGFWVVSGNLTNNFGSLTQAGLYFDILPNYQMSLGTNELILFLGIGIVYQSTRMDISGESLGFRSYSVQNEGWGVDFSAGGMISIQKLLRVFIQYKGISTKSGDQQVGSHGPVFGIQISSSVFGV